MSIRIVTHCYAERLPQYATFLHYQLSSLVLFKADVPINISVCCTLGDAPTARVLNWFLAHHPELYVDREIMSPGELFRRSIGRNRVALSCHEHLVWFTDVDHVFGEGCLQDLWNQWVELDYPPKMMYPTDIQICQDHAIGDALIGNEFSDVLLSVEDVPFTDKKYNRAIGGIQIADGEFVRERGYLNEFEKWQRPRTDNKPFGDFRDDIAFRKLCAEHGEIRRIQLPNLYRLRHTATTYQ